MKRFKYIFCSTVIIITILTSCSDFFNPSNDSILLEKGYPHNKTELLAGYWGIAQTIQSVADKSIYLEGLRGDLLEPTQNAPQWVWDVYNYKDISDESLKSNELANPEGYYQIIINCNDFLVHLKKFYAENSNTLTETKYKGLFGGALRYKAWAYLMLAKIYGKAIYFDDALTSYSDSTLSKYPTYSFDQIVNKCIDLIETGVDGIDGKGTISWETDPDLFPENASTGVSNNESEMTWDRICPPYQCLLAELYLWKASEKSESDDSKQSDYLKAWDNCVSIITLGGQQASYQMNLSEWNGEWVKFFGTQDMTRKEHICAAFYDYQNNQTNHLEEYLSNISPNKYYMRPSQTGMNPFHSQLQTNGTYSEDKYRGSGKTYTRNDGELVLYKYMKDYLTSTTVYRNDPLVSIYRASDVYMFLVESLVGMGRFEEALTFLNGGIGSYYDSESGTWTGVFANQGYPVSLYSTSSSSDGTCQGIRGRVSLGAVGTSVLTDAVNSLSYKKQYLDSILVQETRSELAGESRSYYAMQRMFRTWGDDVRKAWADTVASKYTNTYSGTIKSRLESSNDGWFIKYSLK